MVRTRFSLLALVASIILAGSACGGGSGGGGPFGTDGGGPSGIDGAAGAGGQAAPPGTSSWSTLPPLDILFMVDSSSSMESAQSNLSGGFSVLMSALRSLAPGVPMPSLHIGVITSDAGTGAFTVGVPSCPKQPWGEQGLLQNVPGYEYSWNSLYSRLETTRQTCTPPADRYITVAEGEASTNVPGSTPEAAFACIAPVGTSGCGFESQIGSVMWALGGMGTVPAGNAGFLRPDAHLAIVMVTNEDDCSPTLESEIFDTSSEDLTGQLGPLISFRCNTFGHLCGGAPPPMRPGDAAAWPVVLENCVSSESDYFIKIRDAAAFFKKLKPRPEMLHLAVVAGPTSSYEVKLDAAWATSAGFPGQEWPRMSPSCTTPANPSGAPASTADPAVRLAQLVSTLGSQAMLRSFCDNFATTMTEVASAITAREMLHCADTIQAASTKCTAKLARGGGTAETIPECDSAGATGGPAPCWYRAPSAICSSGTSIVVNDVAPPSEATVVTISCK